ncbi:MAG: site-specific DNA-methyltransferase [Clostridiaceae bacterium]|nr:MAG: site-specific DNA-methyltransferase [Clostridiaceae bacterium]
MSIILCGDALEQLRTLPNGGCRCCVTSPPYYGLRDYGCDGQIGLEQTPEAYIARLVAVFREVRRVLADDGTLWLNIADSYATRSGPQPPIGTRNVLGHTEKHVPPGYKQKDLIGIPWMLAFALRADGWYLRQEIIWHKPNCMPESMRDRCTKSHESIFLLSKRPRYYFDAAAIAEPVAASTVKRMEQDIGQQCGSIRAIGKKNGTMNAGGNGDRRNKRDVWTVATARFDGPHFATFPPELIRPCILAGSAPGDTVLDPFFGAGTTGLVAWQEGREYIGIELSPGNCALANQRIAATTWQTKL